MARKLSAPQFRLLSAMATDFSDGRRGYLSARPSVSVGTAASLVDRGLIVWDTLDEEVAHQITDAGRAAVVAYVAASR